MLGLVEIIFLYTTLAFILALAVPFNGVLVRLRANYNPKGLQLDAEGTAVPHTGPVVKTYFAMFRRVYRLEGIPGLFKGLMPTVIQTFAVTIFVILFVDTEKPRHSKYRAPDSGILGTLFYAILMLIISLPNTILTNRSVTTPVKLGYFNVMHALRVLLTPTELKKPWIIYLTPGLMAAQVLHILIIVLVLGPLRRWLIPEFSEASPTLEDVSVVRVVLYTVVAVVITALITPLEVIATRLSIQRNHASAEYNSVQQEVDGDAEPVEDYGGDEEVIGHEADPYLGLADCAKRVIHEEGVMALYRAWWLTFLGIWGNAFF
ncbi:mitochondrial carrier [Coprinopsis marcescibilis]|uniref:Mitochondrial carrier n=1 Tax=Coprinopsis marcescibilis TaxID=230819 RepID=A0A5C3KZ35_COPMA|nr:mitochondrial carrier [Coprinopsis marcescibilis]